MSGTSGSTTAAGTTFAISAGSPATQDAAGYAALTYTEVGSVQKIGTIGASTSVTKFVPLKGATRKYKGSTDYGSLAPAMAYDPSDAGQLLMRTASAPTNISNYATKTILPTGEILYCQVAVFGYPYDIGGAEDMVMINPTCEINTPIVYVPAGGS